MALRSVSVLQVRCGVCRRNSWRSDVQHQGKAALVGRLHIYHDNPIQGFDRIQVNGFEINDGFYASYESFFRMDGYGFQRAVNEAQREGKPKPHRTVPEDFRTSRGLGVNLPGPLVGRALHDRCPRDHRIDVRRSSLRKAVSNSNSDVLYLDQA